MAYIWLRNVCWLLSNLNQPGHPSIEQPGSKLQDGWLHVPRKISVTKLVGTTLMGSSAIKY